MKVLLSIKPEYAEKILTGKKRFEFRKAVFRNPDVTTVVIYATKPVGKVLGEFGISEIISECPRTLWRLTSSFSGITEQFFNEYFRGRDVAYAIKVKEVKRYEEPIELTYFLPNGCPPQSFCYL